MKNVKEFTSENFEEVFAVCKNCDVFVVENYDEEDENKYDVEVVSNNSREVPTLIENYKFENLQDAIKKANELIKEYVLDKFAKIDKE